MKERIEAIVAGLKPELERLVFAVRSEESRVKLLQVWLRASITSLLIDFVKSLLPEKSHPKSDAYAFGYDACRAEMIARAEQLLGVDLK
jgi:hypothetical protein